MKLLKNLFLLLICVNINFLKSEIVSVVEINRHGARTPKNFPDITSKLFFGSKDMTLTINGYRQHQILGEYVKKKYMKKYHLLSKDYNSQEFKIVSTPTQRTIFSAAGFLSGLYPDHIVKMNYDNKSEMTINDTVPIIDNDVDIQEIPIKVIDPKNDFYFHAEKCVFKDNKTIEDLIYEKKPKAIFAIEDEEKKRVLNEVHVLCKLNHDHSKDHEKAHSEDDKTIHVTPLDIEMKELTKYFFPFFYHFRKYVEHKINPKSLDTIKKFILNRWYAHRTTDSKYLRLTTSAIFKRIMDTFTEIMQNDNKPHLKYRVYSAHDTNIVNILANLLTSEKINEFIHKAISDENTFKFLIPPFASNIFFELHKDDHDGKYSVHIIYNGKSLSEGLKFVEENKQSKKIEWIKFEQMMKNLIDDEFVHLNCEKKNKDKVIVINSIEGQPSSSSPTNYTPNPPSIPSSTNSFLRS
jgi:hypothetical protein